jgi:hypothetical protein
MASSLGDALKIKQKMPNTPTHIEGKEREGARLTKQPLAKAGGFALRTESPDTRRLNDASRAGAWSNPLHLPAKVSSDRPTATTPARPAEQEACPAVSAVHQTETTPELWPTSLIPMPRKQPGCNLPA